MLRAGAGQRRLDGQQVEDAAHTLLVLSVFHVVGGLRAGQEIVRRFHTGGRRLEIVVRRKDLEHDLIALEFGVGGAGVGELARLQHVVRVRESLKDGKRHAELRRIRGAVEGRLVEERVAGVPSQRQGRQALAFDHPHVGGGLARLGAKGCQVGARPHGNLYQAVHRFRDPLHGHVGWLRRDVVRNRGGEAHGDRQGPSRRLDRSVVRLQRQLRLRQGRLGLQHVGDSGHTGVVAGAGGHQVGAVLAHRLMVPLADRFGGVVVEIGLLDGQHHGLHRGVVRVRRGKRGLARELERRRPLKVEQQPGGRHAGLEQPVCRPTANDGAPAARAAGTRTAAISRPVAGHRRRPRGCRSLADYRCVEVDLRQVLAVGRPDGGTGRPGLRIRRARLRVVQQGDVDHVRQHEMLDPVRDVGRDRRLGDRVGGDGPARGLPIHVWGRRSARPTIHVRRIVDAPSNGRHAGKRGGATRPSAQSAGKDGHQTSTHEPAVLLGTKDGWGEGGGGRAARVDRDTRDRK